MSLLGTAQMFLLAALMFCAAGALVATMLVRPLLRSTERWAPADRHRALTVLALTPPLITTAGLVSVTMPTMLGTVWPAFDHCLSHHGHNHLCFVHGSHHAGHLLGWCVVALIGAWCALRLARAGADLLKAAKTIAALGRAARPDPRHRFWIVDASAPLCASVGLFRPRLIMSEGLLAQIGDAELEVIVAHESEHERRRDTLIRLVTRVSTAFVLPPVRRSLLAALDMSAEQACDEHAAAATGDRLAVADAILLVERELDAAHHFSSSALAIGFGGSSVAARVDALLEPARQAHSNRLLIASSIALVAALLGGFEHVHHVTESLLGQLGH
jgi:hypothetical protein